MSAAAGPDYLELSDYVAVLRRRWKSIALLTLLGTALAGAFLVVAPKQYETDVLIQVNALPNNANAVGGRTAGPVNMDNEGQFAKSGTVAALVKAKLHSPLSVVDIQKNISIVVPPNSTYLQINYTASSAVGAQLGANAVGRAYLYERRVITQTLLSTGISALQKQAVTLRATIERLKATIRHGGGSNATSQVRNVLLLKNAQGSLLSVQAHIDQATPLYASLAAPHSVIVGTIVTPATVPTSPSSPRKLLILPGGLALGLVVGLGLAFARDRKDKRIRSVGELERLSRVTTLLQLSTHPDASVGAIEPQLSKAGQAFAELARHVSATLGGGNHVIAVAATAPGLSGSVVAANLAVALARTTDETVVVCGDAFQTRVPELLGMQRGVGLSEALAGQAAVEDVAQPVNGLPRLRVVAPGLHPYGAVSGVRHAKAARFLTDLLGTARYLVIEVHAVDDESGTFPLAEFGETAIIAVEMQRSQAQDVASCVERLERLQTPVLGSVVLPPGGRSASRTAPARPPGYQQPPAGSAESFERPSYERQPDPSPRPAAHDEADADGAADGDQFNLLDFSRTSPPTSSEPWSPSASSRVAAVKRGEYLGPKD